MDVVEQAINISWVKVLKLVTHLFPLHGEYLFDSRSRIAFVLVQQER